MQELAEKETSFQQRKHEPVPVLRAAALSRPWISAG